MIPTVDQLKQRCYRYGPAVVLSLLIPMMSLLPARFFSRFSNSSSIPHVDKWIHALIYAALSLALYHALSPEARKRPGPPLAAAAAATCRLRIGEVQPWQQRVVVTGVSIQIAASSRIGRVDFGEVTH